MEWAEHHIGKRVKCWDLKQPGDPKALWNIVHDHYVVDTALNSLYVAIAYGTFAHQVEANSPTPYGVEIRCAKTGVFLKRLACLDGVDNLVHIAMTRFHVICLRASDDGAKILIACLAQDCIIAHIDPSLWFKHTYGGIQPSLDEHLLLLWAETQLIVLNPFTLETFLYERSRSQASLGYFGYWACVYDKKLHSHQVYWKAAGSL